jgi:chromosome segregation ATPase
MVCKMAKKGLLGLALAAGGLYLAFGTHAPSYVRTAFHKVRNHAKDSVPIQFDIDRAKEEIALLEPAILDSRQELARAEVEVEHLQREIADVEKNLTVEKTAMLTVREKLTKGDLRLASNSPVRLTEEEVKADLAGRLDHYNNVKTILETKRTTLKAQEQSVQGFRQKLADMANQKRALATRVDQIQAKLKAIEATQVKNEFTFDDSALSQAKATVADLEKRLEIKSRVAEMEGRYPADNLTPMIEGRDVLKEFDSEFGATGESPKTGGDKKSL